MLKNVIITVVLAVIVTLAVVYIIKSKKNGKKCIGCPYGGNCGGNCPSQKKE